MKLTTRYLLIVTLFGAMSFAVGGVGAGPAAQDPTPMPDTEETEAVVATEEATEEAEMTEEPTAEAEPTEEVPAVDPETGECAYTWFEPELAPEVCPEEAPVTGEAAFQRFQYGYMLWTEADDNIYVMHISTGDPMWIVAEDPYIPGTPERDFAWPEVQPAQTTQPRMGFGALWRERDEMRARVGWAIQEWEFVYDVTKQTGVDGTILLTDPNGSVILLEPDGEDWSLFR